MHYKALKELVNMQKPKISSLTYDGDEEMFYWE